jgi:hypothetical protein
MGPMRALILVAAVVCTMSISGCSSSPVQGTVEGRLLWVGGFPGTSERPNPGTIAAVSPDGTRTSVRTGSGGHFKMELPVGVTTFSGSSPKFEGGLRDACAAHHKVDVQEDERASVDVICNVR